MQLGIKMDNKNLNAAIASILIIISSVCILKIVSTSIKVEQSEKVHGIVYLISISGRVQISDFKGLPWVENGYYMWYDKKGSKHWTKAPLMFTEKAKEGK